MTLRLGAVLLVTSALASAVPLAAGQPPRTMYERALEREQTLRVAEPPPTLEQLRHAVAAYEAIVRRFPSSAYSDNALWQAGHIALLAYERFGQAADKLTASRLSAPAQGSVSVELSGRAGRRCAWPGGCAGSEQGQARPTATNRWPAGRKPEATGSTEEAAKPRVRVDRS